ncbi:P-type conjugative transfer ATPase TrbB [Burkholderia aenigmatica]|uniref:P-type conjugative transfer ATPase TrbB n=1 Tax=Burkholderia aenigmatica TaxID=2015348 RepID=UPI00264F1846|nr:P-type conjugative transfer ATPase TrbB [Burkholderia aenigmatica]MDN7880109.1 P-type conjugative transfer ATPase TrbB [Burkholderia aenigmatica]
MQEGKNETPEQIERETNVRQQRARESLERSLGTDFLTALGDPKTVEIGLNPDGWWWQERVGETMKRRGQLKPTLALSVLRTIAGFHGKIITRESPLLECEFPLDFSRFAGQIPPVVQNPVFCIRKKAIQIFTPADYVAAGIMTQHQVDVLLDAVANHRNIVVSGGTGSGKTTLLNTIILAMELANENERFVIIEDTAEIQCDPSRHVQYRTTATVDMAALLRVALRMRPDRIIMGESRGREALDVLMAWNTGHEGGALTLHANSPIEALDRILMMVSMNQNAPRAIEPLIGNAVHIIVQIVRLPNGGGRRVTEILQVDGYENGKYITRKL